MKVDTPQIVWHCGPDGKNSAILSIDVLPPPAGGGACQTPSSGAVDVPTPGVVATGSTSDEDGVHLWRLAPGGSQHRASAPPTPGSGASGVAGVSAPVEHMASLSRQAAGGAANAVRFSPDGLHLAVAGDGGSVVVWSVPPGKRGGGNGRHYWSEVSKESDLSYAVLTQQCEDVMDLSWHPDSTRFAVASLDHSVLVFEDSSAAAVAGGAGKWKCVARNRDHSHYVQGVAFDPLGAYLATQGSDRTVRVHQRKRPKRRKSAAAANDAPFGGAPYELGKSKCIRHAPLSDPGDAPPPAPDCDVAEAGGAGVPDGETKKKAPARQLLYADESLETFFRRLAWTPDGALLVTPAGLWRDGGGDARAAGPDAGPAAYATHVYARHRFDRPALVLAGTERASVAVRPNPVPFTIPEGVAPAAAPNLPYRTVFAVLTLDTVLVYDTCHAAPVAATKGAHYAALTDCCWTNDGRTLIVTSSDGYVSFLSFGEGELGTPYVAPVPAAPAVSESASAGLSKPISEKCGDEVTEAGGGGPIVPPTLTLTKVQPKPRLPSNGSGPVRTTETAEGPAGGGSAGGKRDADRNAGAPRCNDLSGLVKKKKKRIQPLLVGADAKQ